MPSAALLQLTACILLLPKLLEYGGQRILSSCTRQHLVLLLLPSTALVAHAAVDGHGMEHADTRISVMCCLCGAVVLGRQQPEVRLLPAFTTDGRAAGC